MNLPASITVTEAHWLEAKEETDNYLNNNPGLIEMGFNCPLNIALRPYLAEGGPFEVGINNFGREERFVSFKGNEEAMKIIIAFDSWYLDYTDMDRPEIPIQLPTEVKLK